MYEGNDTLESPPSYLRGDIVWVKLSGYWWPGEVKNEEDLPSDLLSDFKKPPLVIVKFFEEDSYEYIKHWSNIYPYNCDKKSEFIKKGMAGFRAKLSHMAKFPRDIGTAEEKTNGNPNILSQPEFLPVKKLNYDEIFGTPSPKKSAKGKVTSSGSKKSTSKDNNKPLITHRRFLGNDDYRAYIWVQYTGKDREADSDDEEIQKLNKEPQEILTCPSCSFKAKRLGVMLMHSKMHLDGVYITTKRKVKKPKEDVDSETETAVVKPPKPKQRKKKAEAKPKPVDVFTNLLDEWNDTDEEMDETNNSSAKSKLEVTESEEISPDVTIKDDSKTTDKLTTNHALNTEVVEPPTGKDTHDDIKNCFDFDEEEEDDDFLLPASTGRKIPRVIPEKPRASISELLELSQKEDDNLVITAQEGVSVDATTPMQPETDTNKKEILGINQSLNKPMSVEESIEHSFKELMEETEVPVLDALTQVLKPEQNFHDARTIKFPDKGGTTLKGGTSSKCGSPKKRFVTSFDDFEAGFRKIEDEERRRLAADNEGKRNKEEALKDDTKNSSQVLEAPEEKPAVDVDYKFKKIEDNLLLLGSVAEPEPQSDASTSKQVAERDGSVGKRKSQSTEANSSKHGEVTAIVGAVEVAAKEIESKRKSRRRTRQLVIEEDSEEVIEFPKDEDDHMVEDTEKIVNQLAAFDTEIEAIKKDLEITEKIGNSTEDDLNETTSLEQLTMDLEGSGDSGDFKAVAESLDDRQITNLKKTKRKSKLEENVPKKLEVSIEEPISKKKSAKHKKSSKSHSQSAHPEEEVVLDKLIATEETVAENVAITPTSSSVKTRRGRSKGFQEDFNIPSAEEAAKSSQLEVNTTILEQSIDISEPKIDIEYTEPISKRRSLRDKHHKVANNDENVEQKTAKSDKSQKHKKDEDSMSNELKGHTDETKSVKDVVSSGVTSEVNKEDQNTALSESVQSDKATPRRGRSKKFEVQVTSANKDTSQGVEATTTNNENEEIISIYRKSRTRKLAKPEEEISSVVPEIHLKESLEEDKQPSAIDVVSVPIESASAETPNDPAISKVVEPAAEEHVVCEFDERKESQTDLAQIYPKSGRLRKRTKKEQESTDLKESIADDTKQNDEAPLILEEPSEPKDVISSELTDVFIEPASTSKRSKSRKRSKSELVPEIDSKDSKTSVINMNEENVELKLTIGPAEVRRGRSRKSTTNDDIILPVTASDVTNEHPETKNTGLDSEHVMEATEPTNKSISEPIKSGSSEQTPSETDIKPTTKRRRGKTRWDTEETTVSVSASIDIPKSISEANADKVGEPTDKIEVPTDKIEVPTDKIEVPTDKNEVPTDKIEIPTDKIEVSTEKIEISTDSTAVDSIEPALSEPILGESSKPRSKTRKGRSRWHHEEESTSSTLDETKKPVDVTDEIAMSHSEEIQQQECLKPPEPTTLEPAIEKPSQPVIEEILEIQQAEEKQVNLETEAGLTDSLVKEPDTSVSKSRRSKSRKYTREKVTDLEKPKEGISVIPNIPDFDSAIEKTDFRSRKGRSQSDTKKEDAAPIETAPATYIESSDLPKSKPIHDLPASEKIDKSVKSSSSKSADKYHKRKSSRIHARETEISSAPNQQEVEPDTNKSNTDLSKRVEDDTNSSALEHEIILESSTRYGKHRKRKYTEEIDRPEINFEPYVSKDTRSERRRSRSQKKYQSEWELAVAQTQSAVDFKEPSSLDTLAAATITSEDYLNSTHSIEKIPGLRKSGIISDKVYGRKSKEVRSDKSKFSKSRWDVVAPLESKPEVSASTSHVPEVFQHPMEVTPLAQDSEALPSNATPEIGATSNDKPQVPNKENSDICVEPQSVDSIEVTEKEEVSKEDTEKSLQPTEVLNETRLCEVPQANNQHEQRQEYFKAPIVEDDVANQSLKNLELVITEPSGADKTIEELSSTNMHQEISDTSVLRSHYDVEPSVEEHAFRRKGRHSKKSSILERDSYVKVPTVQENVAMQSKPVTSQSDQTQPVEEHISKGKRGRSKKSSALDHLLEQDVEASKAQRDVIVDVEVKVPSIAPVEEERQAPKAQGSVEVEVGIKEAIEEQSEPVTSQSDETQSVEDHISKGKRRRSKKSSALDHHLLEQDVEASKAQRDLIVDVEIKMPSIAPVEEERQAPKAQGNVEVEVGIKEGIEEQSEPVTSQSDETQSVEDKISKGTRRRSKKSSALDHHLLEQDVVPSIAPVEEERQYKRNLRGSKNTSVLDFLLPKHEVSASIEKHLAPSKAHEDVPSVEEKLEPVNLQVDNSRSEQVTADIESQVEAPKVHAAETKVSSSEEISAPVITQVDDAQFVEERRSKRNRRSSRKPLAHEYSLTEQNTSEIIERQVEVQQNIVDLSEIELPPTEAKSVPVISQVEETLSETQEHKSKGTLTEEKSLPVSSEIDIPQPVEERSSKRKLRGSRKSSAPDHTLPKQVRTANIERQVDTAAAYDTIVGASSAVISQELTEQNTSEIIESQVEVQQNIVDLSEIELPPTEAKSVPVISQVEETQSETQEHKSKGTLTEEKSLPVSSEIDVPQPVEERSSKRKLRGSRKSSAPDHTLLKQVETVKIERQVDTAAAYDTIVGASSAVISQELTEQNTSEIIESQVEVQQNIVDLSEIELPPTEAKSVPVISQAEETQSETQEHKSKRTLTEEKSMSVSSQIDVVQPVEERSSKRNLRGSRKSSAPDITLPKQVETANIERQVDTAAAYDTIVGASSAVISQELTEQNTSEIIESQVEIQQNIVDLSEIELPPTEAKSVPVISQVEETQSETQEHKSKGALTEEEWMTVSSKIDVAQPVEERSSKRKLRGSRKSSVPDHTLHKQVETANIERQVDTAAAYDTIVGASSAVILQELTEQNASEIIESQVEVQQNVVDLCEIELPPTEAKSVPVISQVEETHSETQEHKSEGTLTEEKSLLVRSEIDVPQPVEERSSKRKLRGSRKSSTPDHTLPKQVETANIERQVDTATAYDTIIGAPSAVISQELTEQNTSEIIESQVEVQQNIVDLSEIELPPTEAKSVPVISQVEETQSETQEHKSKGTLTEEKSMPVSSQIDVAQPVEERSSKRKLRGSRKSSAPVHNLRKQVETANVERQVDTAAAYDTIVGAQSAIISQELTEQNASEIIESQVEVQQNIVDLSEIELPPTEAKSVPVISQVEETQSDAQEHKSKETLTEEKSLPVRSQIDVPQPVEERSSKRKLRGSRKSSTPDHTSPKQVEPANVERQVDAAAAYDTIVAAPSAIISQEFTEQNTPEIIASQVEVQQNIVDLSEIELPPTEAKSVPVISQVEETQSETQEHKSKGPLIEEKSMPVVSSQIDVAQPVEERSSKRKLRGSRKSSAPDHILHKKVESANIERQVDTAAAYDSIVGASSAVISQIDREQLMEQLPTKRKLRHSRKSSVGLNYSDEQFDSVIIERQLEAAKVHKDVNVAESVPIIAQIDKTKSKEHPSRRKQRSSRNTFAIDYSLSQQHVFAGTEDQLECPKAHEDVPPTEEKSEPVISKVEELQVALEQVYSANEDQNEATEAHVDVAEVKLPITEAEPFPIAEEDVSVDIENRLESSKDHENTADEVPLTEVKPAQVDETQSVEEPQSERKSSAPDYSLSDQTKSASIEVQVEATKAREDIIDVAEIKLPSTKAEFMAPTLQIHDTKSEDQLFKKKRRSTRNTLEIDYSLPEQNVSTSNESHCEPYPADKSTEEKSKSIVSEIGQAQSVEKHRSERKLRGSRKSSDTKTEKQLEDAEATEQESEPIMSKVDEAQSEELLCTIKPRSSRRTLALDYSLPRREVSEIEAPKVDKAQSKAPFAKKESMPNISKVDETQLEECRWKERRRSLRTTLALDYSLPGNSQIEVQKDHEDIVLKAQPLIEEKSEPVILEVAKAEEALGDQSKRKRRSSRKTSEPAYSLREKHVSPDINDQVEEPKPLKDISDKTEVKVLSTVEKSEPVCLQSKRKRRRSRKSSAPANLLPVENVFVDIESSKAHEENVDNVEGESESLISQVDKAQSSDHIEQTAKVDSLSEVTILSTKDSSTAIIEDETQNASETVVDSSLEGNTHSQTLSEFPQESGVLNLSFNEEFVSKSAGNKSAADEGGKNLIETDKLGIQEKIIENTIEKHVGNDTTIINEPMSENNYQIKVAELESNASTKYQPLEASTADNQALDLSDQHEQVIKDVRQSEQLIPPSSKLQHILESFDETRKERRQKESSKDSKNLLEQEKPVETLLGDVIEDKFVALPDAEPQESTLRCKRLRKYSIQESTFDSKSNEPIDYSTGEQSEPTKTVLEFDHNKTIEIIEKSSRGRPRKSSSEINSHETTAEPLIEKGKLAVPPKKNRWSRRGSYTKTDNEHDSDVKGEIVESAPVKAVVSEETVVEEQTNSVIEKTDTSSLEAATTDNSTTSSFNDSELILPPKKSKRVSEVTSHFLRDSFSDDPTSSEKKCDNDILSFPSYDDSFMSTSLRNNIEGLIKEIDSIDNNTLSDNLDSEVKPFDLPEVRTLSSDTAFANSPLSEDSRGGVKEDLEIPKCVPPKKKKIDIPKDESLSFPFNNLLPNDLPKAEEKIIAPKKKMQKLFESSQAFEKSEKLTELPLMSPLAKKKSFLFHQEEFDQEYRVDELSQKKDVQKLSHCVDNTVEEYLNLPKARKKRKSSSYGDCPPKKEKLEDLFSFEDNQNESKNETEVKLEENDFKFSIQTNLSNLATSQAAELSSIATKTRSDSNEQNSSQPSEELSKKEEIIPPFEPPHEPELVPISGTPTVMSEQDLADAQVEITSDKVISEKKLTTYSMDSPQPGQTKKKATETGGTEFTSKAMVKEFDNRLLMSQPNAYVLKSELLDILEGNSNSSTNSSGSEQKFKTSFDNYDKKSTVQGIIDFEDAIPSQIVLSNKIDPESVLIDSPKLLERLSMSAEASKAKAQKVVIQSDIKVPEGLSKSLTGKRKRGTGIPKPGQKIVIKTPRASVSTIVKAAGSKPIILSEQIIRPANPPTTALKPLIQPQGTKRQYEDIEDVETAFIIPKISKKPVEEEEEEVVVPPTPPEKPARSRGSKSSGKAKILQQTIITPKGEIIPQTSTTTATQAIQLQTVQVQPTADDSVFDINSMPIVLSDDLLTPESIQNMPVVLSEDVLPQTASVSTVKPTEKVLATLPKKIVSTLGTKQIIFKTTQPASSTTVPVKHTGKARILSGSTTPHGKIHKTGATALLATGTTPDGKQAKYVLVPPSVNPAATQVKTVKQVIKKQPVPQARVTPSAVVSVPDNSNQTVGNKIMIVTNAQGQQTRVVLTPQQQKAFMQAQAGSKTKTIIKSTLPKSFLESATAAAGPSGVVAKTVPAAVPQGASPTVSSHGGLLMPAIKTVKTPVPPKKNAQRIPSKPQKTILIKNQLGQTVRKIQGTDDADLDRQVAEQLEAIKASARLQQANRSPEIINYTNRPLPTTTTPSTPVKSTVRRPFSKKVDCPKVKIPVSSPLVDTQQQAETSIPALAPLSPQARIPQVQNQTIQKQGASKKLELATASSVSKTIETLLQQQPQQTTVPTKSDSNKQQSIAKSTEIDRPESPLRQVVIQDGLGNLTTVTVGQILAIPSETVDGQPQSYMLVTVDESGNLTPLNNDALMSLDPSLGAGGDINNMVLQVDQGQATVAAIKPAEVSLPAALVEEKGKAEELLKPELLKTPHPVKEPKTALIEPPKPQEVPLAVEQQIVIGEGVLPGDAGGQQLIVTGDPIATQKFLESLSDGSTDLANILANAEGGSVIIQADGQQILIRTNAAAQPMLGMTESTEGGGNPMFATHKPNQDILAAALANTDVFQPTDPQGNHSSPIKGLSSSQLSPGGGASLYPMHVSNVLETSLTLSSPIMTPLEVPSTNSKKIDDEADILSQVPKNVDLPITITDPNIVQTVAHQQAASLLELTLPISETGHSVGISSPSYSYSLPTLDDSVGISQKSFSSSMPLLTEDVVEVESSTCSDRDRIRVTASLESVPSSFSPSFGSLPMLSESIESSREEVVKTSTFGDISSLPLLSDDVIEDSGSSIGSTRPPRSSPKTIERDMVDEGLSTLGGEMCSSLSEPPPDMFDLSSITAREEEISSDISSIPEPETLSMNSENSGEIPIQPPIVASLNDLKRSGDETDGSDEKRSRFD